MLDFMIISDNADAIFKIVSRLTVYMKSSVLI